MYNNNKDKRTEKRKTGDKGEQIASMFLVERGFKVISRNYLRPYGEIDIVAIKHSVVHFIEVKTVTREIGENDVIYETSQSYRPEDNVHPWKLKRLARVIETYIEEYELDNRDWVIDIITIYLDQKVGKAVINFLENVVV